MRGRVLVVDDDALIRKVSERALARAGFEVVVAATVPEALEAAERGALDVAILDYFLGGECGCNLVAPLRAIHPAIRIAILSGLGVLPEIMRHARHAGADLVASKGLVDWPALARGDAGTRTAVPFAIHLESFKRAVIHGTYLVHHRNVSSAARALGITRTSLQRMLRRSPPPELKEDE